MSARPGPKGERVKGNGFHHLSASELTMDYEVLVAPPTKVEPISLVDAKTFVADALQEAGLQGHRVTIETDSRNQTGIVIWDVNPVTRLKIINALAQRMTFQVGSYQEQHEGSQTEVGMVIFVKEVKGHGALR